MTLNLNRAQRAILLLAALALIGLILWPPWCLVDTKNGKRIESVGHYSSLTGSPVSPKAAIWRPAIDTGLLAQETTVLVLLAAILVIATHGWTKINIPKLRLPQLTRMVLTRPRKIVLLASGVCIICMAIVPPWVNSNPQSDHRGAFLGYAPVWNRPDGRTSAREVLDRLQADTTTAGREWREYQAMKAKHADSSAAPTITRESVRAWRAAKSLGTNGGTAAERADSTAAPMITREMVRARLAQKAASNMGSGGQTLKERYGAALAEQARRDALLRAMPAPHVALLAVQLAGLLVLAAISFILVGTRSSPPEETL